MKTKTIVTYIPLFALAFAHTASALSVNAALEGTTSVSSPIPTAVPANVNLQVTATPTDVQTDGAIMLNADGPAPVQASSTGTASVTTQNSSENAMTSVDTDNDAKVSVTYKRPAKLLGFIPVHIKERATVKIADDGTQTADVSQSWWAFLATKAEVKTDAFLAELKSRLQSSATVRANATLTETEKTQLVSEINAAADAAYRE